MYLVKQQAVDMVTKSVAYWHDNLEAHTRIDVEQHSLHVSSIRNSDTSVLLENLKGTDLD